MRLTNLLATTYVHMLGALSAWLDKTQKQMQEGEAEALLSARLAPDMFPLATQIRFACIQAQEGMFRLRDQEFPPSLTVLLDEGRDAGDRPVRSRTRKRGSAKPSPWSARCRRMRVTWTPQALLRTPCRPE